MSTLCSEHPALSLLFQPQNSSAGGSCLDIQILSPHREQMDVAAILLPAQEGSSQTTAA